MLPVRLRARKRAVRLVGVRRGGLAVAELQAGNGLPGFLNRRTEVSSAVGRGGDPLQPMLRYGIMLWPRLGTENVDASSVETRMLDLPRPTPGILVTHRLS